MSCIQATACLPTFNIKLGPLHSSNVPGVQHLKHLPSMPCISSAKHFPICKASFNQKAFRRIPKLSLKLNAGSPTYQCVTIGAPRHRRSSPLCLHGGKEKENDNEASPWKALEKAMGSFQKNQSVEDVLRQQIQNKEFYDDGGSGQSRGGGGGSGGRGGGDSGESEDESASGMLDELLQVVLATAGFIFLYIYIIEGEEITRLAKDYIKFLFGGQKSVRLKRTMEQWGIFFQKMSRKKEPVDPYWLEKEIINTTTWWDSPEKYRQILKKYLESTSDQPS